LQGLRAEVARTIEHGARNIAVDIDDVGQLDSPVISTLVSILREAREHGAVVTLRAARTSILDTLRVTALDRVFTIAAPDAARDPLPLPPATKNRRVVAAFAAGLLALTWALAGGRASAGDEPSGLDLVNNVIGSSSAIESYQASMSVDVHLRSFPYISQHLDGTTYFKRPDNFEVVFRDVPSYAKGFDKLYSDIDCPNDWARRFVISLVGRATVDGHQDFVVRLVQRVRGMIDHEDVDIDPATWHIDRMEWTYYNGGVISMSQEYQDVGGFSVLARQHATIHIPFVHAGADAVYSDYKTNVAIDDSIFTRNKH
jgi:anti-anti-sigma factor